MDALQSGWQNKGFKTRTVEPIDSLRMKPLAILQFDPMNHPSEFGVFMTAQQIPTRLLRLDLGAKVPEKRMNTALIAF
jgi:hypothetical protein